MRPSYDVAFATSNARKYAEAREILAGLGVRVRRLRIRLEEVQSGRLEEIARRKADDAYARCGGPVIAEDDGLFVDALGGFPGPYSSYALGTIGAAGLLRLLGRRRSASFRAVVAYRGPDGAATFRGRADGSIAARPRGEGWGYDPVFVPRGRARTFAEVPDKNALSHRAAALAAFARWHARRRRRG